MQMSYPVDLFHIHAVERYTLKKFPAMQYTFFFASYTTLVVWGMYMY